jgi:hypothetical protein
MTSSPGPDHEEDDLFPHVYPATPSSSQPPQNLELSPPETQEDIERSRSSGTAGEAVAGQRPNSKALKMLSKKTEAGEEHGTSNNPNSRNYKAGEAWRNKKAQEEYSKVMDNLADQGFSLGRVFLGHSTDMLIMLYLARFGDPFESTPKQT